MDAPCYTAFATNGQLRHTRLRLTGQPHASQRTCAAAVDAAGLLSGDVAQVAVLAAKMSSGQRRQCPQAETAVGLFLDPPQIVRIAVRDRPRGYARYLVRMFALGAGNNVGYPGIASVRIPASDRSWTC
jgi:hypothetical protein